MLMSIKCTQPTSENRTTNRQDRQAFKRGGTAPEIARGVEWLGIPGRLGLNLPGFFVFLCSKVVLDHQEEPAKWV